MLNEQQVTQFQELYRKRFGKEISRERALESGLKLVRLMKLIYKPMTKKEYEQVSKKKTS